MELVPTVCQRRGNRRGVDVLERKRKGFFSILFVPHCQNRDQAMRERRLEFRKGQALSDEDGDTAVSKRASHQVKESMTVSKCD